MLIFRPLLTRRITSKIRFGWCPLLPASRLLKTASKEVTQGLKLFTCVQQKVDECQFCELVEFLWVIPKGHSRDLRDSRQVALRIYAVYRRCSYRLLGRLAGKRRDQSRRCGRNIRPCGFSERSLSKCPFILICPIANVPYSLSTSKELWSLIIQM